MRSRHHFPISLAVGVGLAATVTTPLPGPLVIVLAGLLGTAVDLDHFVIARVRTGSWDPLRRCLADPPMALFEQEDIFEEGDVGKLTRLGTHLVVAAVLVASLAAVAWSLALVAGVTLAAHVASDIVWDAWRRQSTGA